MTEGGIKRRPGATYVCECPRPVVKLEQKRGRIVATLDDGTKMIIPTYRVDGKINELEQPI